MTDQRASGLIDCSLVLEVSKLPEGHLRLQTAFLYPDGSNVDLFIKARPDHLTAPGALSLSDFANTWAWLSHLRLDPLKSRRRKQALASILKNYSVEYRDSALELDVEGADLNAAIINLGQACVRLADMSYTTRFITKGRFNDEVEEILTELELDYEVNAPVPGRFGTHVVVDFLAHAKRRPAAIITLPEQKYATGARQKAEHTFAAFSDLVDFWPGDRVAVFDDRAASYEGTDLERIRTVATLVGVPGATEDFVAMLKAAA